MLFCGPRCVGYEHVLLFLPAQSVVSFFLCLGHIVMEIFSSSVATNCPARLRIRSTSLIFSSSDRCCPELTPRLSRCEFMSNFQANRGTICDPVPSKLHAESEELNEQVNEAFMLYRAKKKLKWISKKLHRVEMSNVIDNCQHTYLNQNSAK